MERYDYDKAYDRATLHRTREDEISFAQTSLGDTMAEEVLKQFDSDDYETVAKAMMLTSGMLTSLLEVHPLALANIVAIAGQHVMSVHKGVRVT